MYDTPHALLFIYLSIEEEEATAALPPRMIEVMIWNSQSKRVI